LEALCCTGWKCRAILITPVSLSLRYQEHHSSEHCTSNGLFKTRVRRLSKSPLPHPKTKRRASVPASIAISPNLIDNADTIRINACFCSSRRVQLCSSPWGSNFCFYTVSFRCWTVKLHTDCQQRPSSCAARGGTYIVDIHHCIPLQSCHKTIAASSRATHI